MKYLFIVCLFFLTSYLQAKNYDIRQVSIAIPSALSARGIDHIGSINLKELTVEIETKLKWMVLPVFSIGAGTNGRIRSGSSCHVKDKLVIINQPHLENLNDIFLIQGLLLHEALCALGWNDDNYALSSLMGVLYILSTDYKQFSKNEIADLLERTSLSYTIPLYVKRRQKDPRYTIDLPLKGSEDLNYAKNVNFFKDKTLFMESKKIMTSSGGTVTGGGGGGNGFGWFLKTLIFKNFIDVYKICSQSYDDKVLYFNQTKNEGGYKIFMTCSEVRARSWWQFILNLNVEVAQFNYSQSKIYFPIEMPWFRSFLVEEIPNPLNFTFKNDLILSFDELRWMMGDRKQWSSYSSGVFLTLLVNYYNLRQAEKGRSSPVFEFDGEETFVQMMRKVFERATLRICQQPLRDSNSSSFNFMAVSKEQYFFKLLSLDLTTLESPPYCVTWVR